MYNVLIVDDEEIIKIGLRTILNWEDYGFKIVGTAENGEQALKLVKELTPDVVITDLYMPIMNGLELIKRIKANGYHCEIVVLSNYGDLENVKQAMKLGAEDYLLKVSYDKQKFIELLRRLESVLKKKENSIEREQTDGNDNTADKMKDFLCGTGNGFYNCEKKYYQLFFISLPQHLESLEDSQYIDVMKKIKLILEENFNMYSEKYLVSSDRLNFAFIVSTGDNCISKENTMHIKMQKTLAVYLMIHSSIIFENNLMGIHKLREAFIKAKEMAEVVFWETGCFHLQELKFNSVSELINMPKSVNRYKKYIENPDLERLNYEVNNVLNNCAQNLVDPHEAKQFVIILFSNIRVFIYQYYGKDLTTEYEQKIKQAKRVEELKTVIQYWMEELKKFMEEINMDRGNATTIDRIKYYIEHHINEKLRVNEIAEHFNFHPNYLGTYFKEQTGVTLINYINRLKMDYAKELLEQKKYRVKEVAMMVGIDDPLYFNKMFKNFFGCPPSKYEKK